MKTIPRMIFGAYVSYGAGHHAAAWRHPSSNPHAIRDIDFYCDLARKIDQKAFDFIFVSDAPAVFNDDRAGYGGRVASFEPLTLLSHLSAVTKRVGLVATGSTTYYEPYNLARLLLSLDLVSDGRCGWNMVTTSKNSAAGNFGLSNHPPHALRYERANEFVEIVQSLWSTWCDDAFVADAESGRYYLPSKRNETHFDGKHLSVHGELNVPRSRQGSPVIVQAGSSCDGVDLAIRTAEMIFTAQPDLSSALRFVGEINRRSSQRVSKNRPLVLPGVTIYADKTTTEARSRVESLQALVEPELGLSMLSDLLGGFDLSNADIDAPLPRLPQMNGNRSRRRLLEYLSWEKGYSVRSLYKYVTTSRGHLTVVGSYDQVADILQDWWECGACDGFSIMPALSPSDITSFQDEVFPRLVDRGIAFEAPDHLTFRERINYPISYTQA